MISLKQPWLQQLVTCSARLYGIFIKVTSPPVGWDVCVCSDSNLSATFITSYSLLASIYAAGWPLISKPSGSELSSWPKETGSAPQGIY